MKLNNLSKYAAPTVRIGMALLFLWFGIAQLVNPASFLGYVPQWLVQHEGIMQHEHPFQSIHNIPLTAHLIIMGNGLMETIFGTLLLIGLFTRIVSLILSIHLIGIALSLGYNDIMIRDIGLAIATFTIFMHGPDKWCISRIIHQKISRNKLLNDNKQEK